MPFILQDDFVGCDNLGWHAFPFHNVFFHKSEKHEHGSELDCFNNFRDRNWNFDVHAVLVRSNSLYLADNHKSIDSVCKKMNQKKLSGKLLLASLLATFIAILFDFIIHYTLSSPMETFGYFFIKFTIYYIFATIFLILLKQTFLKIVIAGIVISSLFGIYYNLLPAIGYTPFGISLKGLSVLGISSYLFVGLFFGIVHTLGFMLGIYSTKLIK